MHKGYAEVVTLQMVAERDKKAFYVPHHGARKKDSSSSGTSWPM